MKNINRKCSKVLVQFMIAGMIAMSASGAVWDDDFHTSFMNSVGNDLGNEGVSCITTFGTEVYLGSHAINGTGRIWRYKESDGSWLELATVSGGTNDQYCGVQALSAAQDTISGDVWLFVGGDFTGVTFGSASSSANNVVALNLTQGSITQMGAGTSGPVWTLKAISWWDHEEDPGGVRVLVGGKFTTAGGSRNMVISKSIALWRQDSSPAWLGFSGGLLDDGATDLPKVYGVEAKTSLDSHGTTRFDGIWLTGALRRGVGSNTNVHIAKLTGSFNTWTYIGRAFQQVAVDTETCAYSASIYPSFFGTDICLAGTNVYFGGFSRGHQRADGAVLFCSTGEECGCSACPGGYSGLVTVGTSSTSIAADCCVSEVKALTAKGNDVYASGPLWYDESLGNVYFGKLSDEVWTAIPQPAYWEGAANAAASTSNYVYFATYIHCGRYSP